MKRCTFILLILYLSGCNIETGFPELAGKMFRGTYKISHLDPTDSHVTYSEHGTIQIKFTDISYHYRGTFGDTTSGLGSFFKDGLNDGGNYLQTSNIISLLDSAVNYGVSTPIGAPSLYLDGNFLMREENEKIILINEKTYRVDKIELYE